MQRQLQALLDSKKEELLTGWFDQVIGAYPPETVKYFAKKNNTFTNPIGSNVYKSLSAILDELLGAGDADKMYQDLEMILRIKAVQDVQPSKAVAFMPAFKSIVEKVFKNELANGTISLSALLDFYSELDALTLLGFNIYSESRELIYTMRIDEIKQTNDLLQKANLLNESVDTSVLRRCSNYIEEK